MTSLLPWLSQLTLCACGRKLSNTDCTQDHLVGTTMDTIMEQRDILRAVFVLLPPLEAARSKAGPDYHAAKWRLAKWSDLADCPGCRLCARPGTSC